MKTLTKETAVKLNGDRIRVKATKQIDWFIANINDVFRVFVDERDNTVWLFKGKATRKGCILSTLNNPMYETI